ncbi:aminotransferase class I/II-fold pyridoxal phosphate-dependent enzyme [Cyclobacterium plantarum]|uniref:Aminotransferase class I/II-fold pyridoxal phosphate-dependent enzyme n=1 Tax=Cyclobacterium plantarum TaxID=2716263 RepID=A0ABX0HDS8_9BACT|nr:aminotransferase class I/II-fold pyridoxal phosphate-dependent enzyme [Cyclobacterium plantarum]NHE59063.1 aminotransferase class I/II-fold pyridoxal phosphate-dependent enzyme [Cyclobacterium plantarum]
MSHKYLTRQLGREIVYNEKTYLHFSGTAYLGIGALPEFKNLLIEGIKKHGPNHGSSRTSNVQLPIYEQFETEFAKNAGAPEALLLSSGYMAGQLALETLKKQTDLTWVAPDTHPAILPSRFKPYSDTFSAWTRHCIQKSRELMGQNILMLSNAVNPLKPEVHDFRWTKNLSPANRYFLLVDDSHAFGILGENLFGTYASWKDLPVNLTVCGSLGKALSLPAGIILGDGLLMENAKNSPVFRSSSPPAPAFLDAFLQGIPMYLKQRKKLLANMDYMYGKLSGQESFQFLPDYPVITFENTAWVDQLHRMGFILSSFPYPGPEDRPVNRIVVSAWHKKEDLNLLLQALMKLQ